MKRIWKVLLFVVAAPALLVLIYYALNNIPRYLSWHNLTIEELKEDARWSFYNGRFIINHGHFQGSAGSFYPIEECTKSDVLWGAK